MSWTRRFVMVAGAAAIFVAALYAWLVYLDPVEEPVPMMPAACTTVQGERSEALVKFVYCRPGTSRSDLRAAAINACVGDLTDCNAYVWTDRSHIVRTRTPMPERQVKCAVAVWSKEQDSFMLKNTAGLGCEPGAETSSGPKSGR